MKLILIRGLPGSGKTTMAKTYLAQGFCHYEADMFFEQGGVYCYDQDKIKDAHAWCQRETVEALLARKSVVVSNTFTRHFELEPYLTMCKKLNLVPTVLVATGQWENTHGVPAEVVEKMRQRWEP